MRKHKSLAEFSARRRKKIKSLLSENSEGIFDRFKMAVKERVPRWQTAQESPIR